MQISLYERRNEFYDYFSILKGFSHLKCILILIYVGQHVDDSLDYTQDLA